MDYNVGKKASSGGIVKAIQVLVENYRTCDEIKVYGEGTSFSSWNNRYYQISTTTYKIIVCLEIKSPLLVKCEWGPEHKYVDYIFYDYTRRHLTQEEQDILREWAVYCKEWSNDSVGIKLSDIEDFFGDKCYLAGIELPYCGCMKESLVYEYDHPSDKVYWKIRVLFE